MACRSLVLVMVGSAGIGRDPSGRQRCQLVEQKTGGGRVQVSRTHRWVPVVSLAILLGAVGSAGIVGVLTSPSGTLTTGLDVGVPLQVEPTRPALSEFVSSPVGCTLAGSCFLYSRQSQTGLAVVFPRSRRLANVAMPLGLKLLSATCERNGACYGVATTAAPSQPWILIRSNDGGVIWHSAGAPTRPSGLPPSVSCPTRLHCVAVQDAVPSPTSGYVAEYGVTEDGGQTWVFRRFPANYTFGASCASIHDCLAVIASGNGNGRLKGQLIQSNDGGWNWHAVGNAPSDLAGVDCYPSTLCLAYGGEGRSRLLFASHDGGRSWALADPRYGGVSFLVGPWCSSETYCYGTVFSSQAQVALVTSSDGGWSWQLHEVPWSVNILGPIACTQGTMCVGDSATSNAFARQPWASSGS